jgi:hypothetical protein
MFVLSTKKDNPTVRKSQGKKQQKSLEKLIFKTKIERKNEPKPRRYRRPILC